VSNEVEEIKKKLDIINVINRYVPLKKRGRHHVACCPFHQEKTPSFLVSPELQIFKCFGCGKSGDIFTFVQEYERIDFREALEELAKLAGVTLEKNPAFSAQESHQKTLFALNTETAKFYHYILTSHPLGRSALQYVLGRGINLATVKQFKIGFAPDDSSLHSNYLTKKGFSAADLTASGTFLPSHYGRGFYDRFSGRLTFPLIDYRGRVQGFSGRVLPGAKAEMAKYINSPETEIYHKSQTLFGLHLTRDSIKRQDSVIVVEGEFDLISPFQSGFTNIVAIKGTAFTPEQLQLLKRYTSSLILALDSDFAGSAAARRSIELADSLDFDIKVLDLGDRFKDPDEAVKSDPAYFKKCLDNALPVWDFFLRAAVKSNDPGTPSGKKNILSLVLPSLVKIQNLVIRSDYLKKLADLVNSDLEAVIQESLRYSASAPASSAAPPPPTSTSITPSPQEKLEEFLLILLLAARHPALLSRRLRSHLQVIATPRFLAILSRLQKVKKFLPGRFQEKLAPEIQPVFQSLYLQATSLELDSRARQREIRKTIAQLNGLFLKEKLAALSRRLTTLGDSDPALEAEYNQTLALLNRYQLQKS